MRVRTVLRLAVWGALVGYVAFVTVSVVSNYFEMVALVEGAVQKSLLLRQPDVPAGSYAEEVRDAILRGAERSGLSVDDRNVHVSQTGKTLRVGLKWSYPVVTLHGEPILAIPLSLKRSFDVRP